MSFLFWKGERTDLKNEMAGSRRMMIGWMYHWGKNPPKDCPFAGALSAPRELLLDGRQIRCAPAAELAPLLKKHSPWVQITENQLTIYDQQQNSVTYQLPPVSHVEVLEDVKSVEVFINQGAYVFSHWLI